MNPLVGGRTSGIAFALSFRKTRAGLNSSYPMGVKVYFQINILYSPCDLLRTKGQEGIGCSKEDLSKERGIPEAG